MAFQVSKPSHNSRTKHLIFCKSEIQENLNQKTIETLACTPEQLEPRQTDTHTHKHCSCGHTFSIAHAMSCPTGGYPSIRHNEIRDITASLLTEVCHSVSIEPHLQPMRGESLSHRTANTEDQSRLDIAVCGFWGGRFEKAFLDVRVFNPSAQSNQQTYLASTHRRHELEKIHHYEQRIREVEHSTFTPLVLSSTGGMGRAATIFYETVHRCSARREMYLTIQ